MSDYDFPDLPSDEELGITDEDREAYAKEFGDEPAEMSDTEMRALLGDAPAGRPGGDPSATKPTKKDKSAAKRAKKEAARRAKQEEKRRKAAAKQAKADADRAVAIAKAAGSSTEPGPVAPASEAKGRGKAAEGRGKEKDAPAAAASDEGRRRVKWRGAMTLTFLVGVSWIASARTLQPGPEPANAPDTEFASARAMATLIEIATRPHPPGSPDHARVRALLMERLRGLGLDPEVQTATALVRRDSTARAATVRNIVARLPGTDPTGAVLLTAHYDGRDISPAAADDGVGVVTILEALRALRETGPVRNDIIVLLTDGEELGTLGARTFVNEHPWIEDVSIVLGFEMRGAGGPAVMFETNDLNGWVVRAFADFDPSPVANSMSYEVYRRMGSRDTDFTPFRQAGKQGLNFAAIGNAHVYHQAYDRPAALSESSLQHHGLHALSAARFFGQADLSSVNAENVVFFSIPFAGLIVYDEMWVLPISGLIVVLLIAAFFAARYAGARPARIGTGAALAFLMAVIAYAASFGLVSWLPRFHPEAGSLQGSLYHREGWYVIGMSGIAFTTVMTVYAVARRWLSATELAAGAMIVPSLVAVGVSFYAPLAAMNFQWPAVAGLVSLVLLALLKHRYEGAVGWVAGLLLSAPVLLLLVWVTEMVWLALTFELGATLTLPVVLTLWLCLPALEGLRHPNAWWASLMGLAVTAGAVGLGIVGARPSDTKPAPSTLVYAYEHGTGSAVWATDPTADSVDAAAMAWAVARAGGTFDGRRDLTRFAYPEADAPTVAAPVVSAQPPEVVVARDTIVGTARRVTLRVRSSIGAEYLAFTPDERGDTRMLSVNGKTLSDPAELVWLEHWGVPEPAVELELEMPSTQPIGLHVIEHLLRPEELLGASTFERPPELAPDITRLSDRAMFRYSVGAFADPRFDLTPPATPAATPAADTAGVTTPSDTSSAAGRDTLAVPDTGAVPPDTAAVAADTAGTAPDSLPVDTLGAAEGSPAPTVTGAVVDTTAADPSEGGDGGAAEITSPPPPPPDTLSADEARAASAIPPAASMPGQPVPTPNATTDSGSDRPPGGGR